MFLRIWFLIGWLFLTANCNASTDLRQTYLDVASTFNLEPCLLQALIDWEGGEVGKVTHHSNGQKDIGLAQVNEGGEWERHFASLGISKEDLRDNPYVAILAAGYILRTELNRSGDIIQALSAYNRGFGRRDSVSGYRYSKNVLGRYGLLVSRNMCYIRK